MTINLGQLEASKAKHRRLLSEHADWVREQYKKWGREYGTYKEPENQSGYPKP